MKKSTPLIRKPWFEFLSSMRFAVSLLTILAIASIIGTVLNQNEALSNYAFKFGPFWFEIFQFLGLYDVYSASWFVLIMIFLVLSTSLCLIRNTPNFIKDFKSFRLKATSRSLKAMKHHHVYQNKINPDIANSYLIAQGFSTRTEVKDDGQTIIAAKKGSASKLGYIFAHAALIIICIGGLIDSDLLLKTQILIGQIVPDKNAVYQNEFPEKSRLSSQTLSYRGNVSIREGNQANAVFLSTPSGFLVQELPFTVKLDKFLVEYYDTGMPKNFVSDITVTDKQTGKETQSQLRVNHPITINGVTLYQSSFGDGGSKLKFKAWNLVKPALPPVRLDAVSMNDFPLNLGKKAQYTLEFNELKVFNIEDNSQNNLQTPNQKLHEIRDVKIDKNLNNIGPSIGFKLRDNTGQAIEYVNYMTPINQNGTLFFMSGVRKEVGESFQFLRIPADNEASINGFMLLNTAFQNPQLRQKIAHKIALATGARATEGFEESIQKTMELFAQGGYVAVDQFIRTNIPEDKRQQMAQVFLQILHGATAQLFEEAQKEANVPVWAQDQQRDQFLLNSLLAMTDLHEYGSPLFLQLEDFEQVQSSGLQMTRSPGKNIVYFGSLLLVLGIFFMFYIRDKRAWLLFGPTQTIFAMSSARHNTELDKEFTIHTHHLEQYPSEE